MSTFFRPVALLAALSVSACGDTLFFAERDSFKLAIHVAEDPVAPLQVSAGVKRSVITIAPPQGGIVGTGNQRKRAEGDAVNMFSGFDLKYVPPPITSPFSGKLAIKTQFASGRAALAIAGDPNTVEAIMGVGKFQPLPPTLVPRLKKAFRILQETKDDASINRLAAALKIPTGPAAREDIRDLLRRVRTEGEFAPIAQAFKATLRQDPNQ